MANHMKVLDSSVRQQKAVMVDVFSPVPQYVQGSLVYRLAIFRMNSLPRHLDHRRALLRVKFKTAEHLVGPVIPFVAAGGPGPAARFSEPLCLRQIRFAAPQ